MFFALGVFWILIPESLVNPGKVILSNVLRPFPACRPLHLVAPLVHLPELCELLLQAGALLDSKNSQLSTPLMDACKENNLFMARILIGKGEWLMGFLGMAVKFLGKTFRLVVAYFW